MAGRHVRSQCGLLSVSGSDRADFLGETVDGEGVAIDAPCIWRTRCNTSVVELLLNVKMHIPTNARIT